MSDEEREPSLLVLLIKVAVVGTLLAIMTTALAVMIYAIVVLSARLLNA